MSKKVVSNKQSLLIGIAIGIVSTCIVFTFIEYSFGNNYISRSFKSKSSLPHASDSIESMAKLIPDGDKITYHCIDAVYDKEKSIFISTDTRHPRYGGSLGETVENSDQFLDLIKQVRKTDNLEYIGRTYYCETHNDKRIVVSLPSKQSNPVNILLTNSNLEIENSVSYKVADVVKDCEIPSFYTADNILYLKCRGLVYIPNNMKEEALKIDLTQNKVTVIGENLWN